MDIMVLFEWGKAYIFLSTDGDFHDVLATSFFFLDLGGRELSWYSGYPLKSNFLFSTVLFWRQMQML